MGQDVGCRGQNDLGALNNANRHGNIQVIARRPAETGRKPHTPRPGPFGSVGPIGTDRGCRILQEDGPRAAEFPFTRAQEEFGPSVIPFRKALPMKMHLKLVVLLAALGFSAGRLTAAPYALTEFKQTGDLVELKFSFFDVPAAASWNLWVDGVFMFGAITAAGFPLPTTSINYSASIGEKWWSEVGFHDVSSLLKTAKYPDGIALEPGDYTVRDPQAVPDSGSVASLMLASLAGLVALRRRHWSAAG